LGILCLAEGKQVTVAQLAVAWVLARGDDVIPLVGSRKPKQLHVSLGALSLNLSPRDLLDIEAAIPSGLVAGEYYPVSKNKRFT